MARYGIETRYTFETGEMIGEYRICDYDAPRDKGYQAQCVWSRLLTKDDEECDPYPPDVCAEYERLCGRGEFIDWDEPPAMPNIVELFVGEDECAWDQPCAFGNRVDGHAVYCHNEKWLYAPRKCRRTWYTGGRVRDEDCRGFKQNPFYKNSEAAHDNG